MVKKLINSMKMHDHWFAEWWSSVLLIAVGIYAFITPDHFVIQQSFIDGFLEFLPFNLWKWLFIAFGLMQAFSLRYESLFGRGIAAFSASALLIWGTLNIAVYGQWHFSLVAWGIFAVINLYALYRIARGIEKHYELL